MGLDKENSCLKVISCVYSLWPNDYCQPPDIFVIPSYNSGSPIVHWMLPLLTKTIPVQNLVLQFLFNRNTHINGLLSFLFTLNTVNFHSMSSSIFCFYIWVEMFCPWNRHFLCHILSVFILTWSQNEPSESQEKNNQYTEESNDNALFFFANWLHLKQMKKKTLVCENWRNSSDI